MELNRNSLRGASLGRVSLRGVSLIGRTGDEPAQDFEGYPLAIDIASAKRTQSYIIYGNTGENAQGVGRELLQLVPENLAPVTSRGFVFSIENNIVKVHGTRTQEGEVVNKYGSVKAGHKYLYYDYWNEENGWHYCTQLWASGHNAIYIFGRSRVFTAPADMDAYLQIDRRDILGTSINQENAAPLLIDLTAAGWEDITTGDELAERMGYKQPSFITDEHRIPYGSSFVAPIRVGSRNLLDIHALAEYWGAGFEVQGNTLIVKGFGSSFANHYRFADEPITVTLSGKVTAVTATNPRLQLLRVIDGSVVATTEINTTRSSATLLANAIRMNHTSSGSGDIRATFADLMLELGSTATAYEPYRETLYPSVLSSPLHKIGDIVDYKESNGKEWHGCVEYAFTGQETINYYDTQIGAPYPKRFVWLTSGIAGATNTINCASNDYTATDYENLLRGNTNKVVSSEVRGYVNIVDSDYTSAADFKAHLAERYASGNPVKVVLKLATPTEVQGEPLPRLAIPKGTSIVTLDTEVEPSNITAKV